jgi:chemosensory pili system protein ChpA (sensor histidine kinase/response regulator)
MSVLASGAAVLIYNPVALVSVYGEQARALSLRSADALATTAADNLGGASPAVAEPMPMGAPQSPLVLVVDDSITVRRVTQRLLKREGYRVALAADGLLALEQLAIEKPTVVLSDIEMPRMDGFDLARNIRGHAEYKHLPIIMITSRIAEKHREHARELGVDHYLGKPYSEDELLRLVQQYCAAAIPA